MFKTKKRIIVIASIIGAVATALIVYFILIISGAINLIQTNLIFTSGSKEIDYSPNVSVVCHEAELESGNLRFGHYYKVDYLSTLTEIGSIDNEFVVTIYDSNGNVVTSKYEITLVPGTLTIKGIPIKIQSDSNEKVYDGTELICDSWWLLSGNFLAGHRFFVEVTSSATTVGVVDNDFMFVVLDENDLDVTRFYSLEKVLGKLTITEKSVSVMTASDEKSYDGQKLTHAGYTVLTDVIYGHTIHIETVGEIIDVGKTNNGIIWYVLDANNNDVSNNYTINLNAGTLEVKQRTIELFSESETHTYDGEEFSHPIGTVEGLLDGHNFEVIDSAKLTDVGIMENWLTIVILDQDKTAVTSSYNISTNFGCITVFKKMISIKGESDEKVYDGTPLINETFTPQSNFVTGHEPKIVSNTELTIPGSVQNILSFMIFDEYKNDVTANYEITVLPGILTVTKREIVITTPCFNLVYDTSLVYFNTLDNNVALYDEVFDKFYINFVGVGDVVGSYLNQITIEFENEEASNYYDIKINEGTVTINKQTIYIQTASASAEYANDSFLSACSSVIYINDVGYTVYDDFYSGIFEIYNYIIVKELGVYRNTATVKLLDSENYELIVTWGGLTVWESSKGPLSISPKDIYVGVSSNTVYASSVYGTNENLKGLDALLTLGYSYEATVSGEINSIGYASTTITSFVLRDKTGEIVAMMIGGQVESDEYKINVNQGIMVMSDVTITVTGGVAAKQYDGTALTITTSDINVSGAESIQKLGYTIDIIGSITNVGTMNPYVVVYNQYGEDVTKLFHIINSVSILEVKKSSFTIDLGDLTVTNDLDLSSITIDKNNCSTSYHSVIGYYDISLFGKSGEQYSKTIIDSSNAIVKIYDKDGNDITSNFEIKYLGWIIVN